MPHVTARVISSSGSILSTQFTCPLCGELNNEDSFTVDELRAGAVRGLQGCYSENCPADARIVVHLEPHAQV